METLKNRHEIKLKKPARYWDDGLPIGNGRLGAMVMGKVNEETIYLNEETIWYGRDLDRKNPDTGKYLDQIRELSFVSISVHLIRNYSHCFLQQKPPFILFCLSFVMIHTDP